MHKEGHVGIGFLLYAPLAYWLVANDWMMLFAFGMIGMGVWSFLPDIDITLPVRHRGPTHSIPAALVAGFITAALFGYLAGLGILELASLRGWSPQFTLMFTVGIGFVVGFGGVIGHILGDVLTPMGVQPFWPRWNRKFSLGLVLAADKHANKQLSMIGAVALTAAIVLARLGL